ncbi:MAG: monovalent cation:proton antiporter-2 (CPA2) family protein [Burkholderiaceae bacterium]|jgi:glutathione-regulated potassium-efflux system protein KefB|nr:monovalent cation:proton antiporter-2 (CPA2) family protein [Burkholderiaceae bacterium]
MPTEPSTELVKTVVLLAAGVIAVPLFKRLRLGSVLAYLVAGLLIGPFGLRFFTEPEHILRVAELGVVMFLFIIGLEMRPRRLWGMRRQIFGAGLVQVVVCGAALTGLGMLAGYRPAVAFVAAMGFVLTSTATVMQLLDERGETLTPPGQRIVSILLLEDLAIVPLLAIVAVLSPDDAGAAAGSRAASNWLTVGAALAAVIGLVAVSRWLLNPMFEVLARSKAREVMTAAALLVVLGAALAMQWSGLSMAMGAFVAGVMLSESSFRHELEADIEPFRGILLGLFFISVGMSLDLRLVLDAWLPIVLAVVGYMAVKAIGVYAVARLGHAGRRESLVRATLMAQGGEFAFVLYAAAAATGLLDARTAAVLSAIVIVSIAVTPLLVPLLRLLPERRSNLDGVESVQDATDVAASVLLIGFGRFGQIASQALLARGIDLAIIDSDPDMIRAAAGFGFKVYYGDGTRLDVLHASGAGQARAILVCVDDKESTARIVELVKHEWPLVPVLARSYDRQHAIELIKANVDYQIRETFESALAFSIATLEKLGATAEEAADVCQEIRRRDATRLELQVAGDLRSGGDLILRDHRMTPTPLTTPRRPGEALSEETAEALGERPEAG